MVPWLRSAMPRRCANSSIGTFRIARSIKFFSRYGMPQHGFWKAPACMTLPMLRRPASAKGSREERRKNRRYCPWSFTAAKGRRMRSWAAILSGLIFGLITVAQAQGNGTVIRVGAFPNITHPQAMIGKANGWFEKAMGPQVKVEWKSFNAGPSAIEALFADAIDMTYVGPNPAINGYVRSNGEALRVVAGAASGGAAQVIVRRKFLKAHPELVKNWVRAHVELTDWINEHLDEAKQILNRQIQKETGKALSPEVLQESWGRLQATYDPLRASLLKTAQSAFEAGFLGRPMPDLAGLYDLTLLNQVLEEKNKKAIQ